MGIILIFFLLLHMAMSYEVVKDYPLNHDYKDVKGNLIENRSFNYVAFFDDLGVRLINTPRKIKWVNSSLKFLLGGGFVYLIIIGYIITSKKKYIFNKEYGTSDWGNKKQIAHLLAKNLKKTEIKVIKKERGSRREKTRKIADAKLKYTDDSNIILTQSEKICMYNFELNNNTMIIGGAGSSKTRGFVLPNILQCSRSPYSPSIICTDPKGEIIIKVGKYLEKCGYVIKVLNLKEQNRSYCFNPFRYILEEKYEEQISSLVSSIMDSRSENKEQKSNDPFWEDMAKVLLKAIFYATYEGFPMEEQNMSTVMELFRWFEVSDHDDRYDNPTRLDKFFDIFGDINGTYKLSESILQFYKTYYSEGFVKIQIESNLILQKVLMREKISIPLYSTNSSALDEYRDEITILTGTMRNMGILSSNMELLFHNVIDEIDHYIQNRFNNYESDEKPIGVSLFGKYGDVNNNPALRNWEDFRTKCKGKTAQSVTATALAKVSPFDEEQVRRIFSRDEMELDLVGERKTALFIVLPPTNKTYNFIANVLYTQLFEQLEYCATVKHNQKLPVPVRFILDEFYNTGRIPNFENILSYARSFGIGISIILQSLDQIKEMYEKSWGTILDNCSTFLYLGSIRHFDTLKYISDLLGKGTFDKKTYSRTKGRQSSSSTNFDKIGRDLLDPAEVQRINKRKCLLFVSGYQPYMSKKFDYKKHKQYKYTSDCNKENLYYYKTPIEGSHAEEMQKSNGGQENISTQYPKTSPIILNINEEEVMKILKDNILNLDLESGEEVSLSIDEEEEIKLMREILIEEENTKDKVSSIKRSVTTPLIEISKDVHIVNHIVNNMLKEIENVDFMSPSDMDEELGEFWEDDIVTDIDNIELTMKSLTNDMVTNGFLEDINGIDISDLQMGEVYES